MSEQQRRVLHALNGGGDWTPAALAALLDTSPEGAAATASSLVRRGLARRLRRHSRVVYRCAPRP